MEQPASNNSPAPAAPASFAQDGTIEAAARSITASNIVPLPDRAPDGKFKGNEPVEAAPKAEEPAPKVDDPVETADDDDDYLEIEEPGDDGKPVIARHKVVEVYEGFRKAKDLEAQLGKAKTAQPMPEEIETALTEIVSERTRYLDALSQWETYNQPKMPPRELRDINSPYYNPEEYVRLMGEYERKAETQKQVQAERHRVQSINDQEQKALSQARHQRERARLLEVWPEIAEKATAQKVLADLGDAYGLDEKTVNSVIDHRFYKMAKDALAYRKQATAKQEAVKVVRAKPKLVRAGARSAIDTKAASRQNALGRLQQTGSLDDATALISALNR